MVPVRKTLTSGRSALWFDTVGSTNDEARMLGKEGEAGPIWVFSKRQTQGRGRNNRRWIAQEGNLHASLLVRIACRADAAVQLSIVAGIAVFDATQAALAANGVRLSNVPIWLKWPNDIMIGDGKVGGLLIETSTQPGTAELAAVVGVGVNLLSAPQSVERPATSLKEYMGGSSASITPYELLCALDISLINWIEAWQCGAQFEKVRLGWLERAGKKGHGMIVNTGTGQVSGVFEGLDTQGRLLLRNDKGKTDVVSFGDVDVL